MTIELVAPDTAHDPNVAVLAWPHEAFRATRAKQDGRARLLLVAHDADAPDERDLMTDWVRLPASPADIEARVGALDRHVRHWMPPRVDEYDVLWRGSAWCALSPIEATIVRTLIEWCPSVVSRREIAARVWPAGVPKGRPVDGRLHRLRARLAPLGIHIHSIRQRGLLLAVDPPAAADPAT
jgi:hypothetical protein